MRTHFTQIFMVVAMLMTMAIAANFAEGNVVVNGGAQFSVSNDSTAPFNNPAFEIDKSGITASENPADGTFGNNNPDDLLDDEISDNFGTPAPNSNQWVTDQFNPTLTFTFDSAQSVGGIKIDWAWMDRDDGVYEIVINGSTSLGTFTADSPITPFANPSMEPTYLLFDSAATGVNSIDLVITGQDANSPGLAELTFFVPEPASIALLGLGGLMVLRRRS